jgi:hypothetical protein
MTDFFYFAYYRLHKWAEQREQNIPIILVLTWLTVVTFFHVCTLLSLITIIFRIDAGFRIPASNLGKVAWFIGWAFLIWIGLKVGRVKERAYSPERIARYEKKGFKAWWLIAYILASFAAMAATTWIAGAMLRANALKL